MAVVSGRHAGTFNSPWDHYYRPYDQQAEKRRWGEGVLWMKRKREEECDSDDDYEEMHERVETVMDLMQGQLEEAF